MASALDTTFCDRGRALVQQLVLHLGPLVRSAMMHSRVHTDGLHKLGGLVAMRIGLYIKMELRG